MAGRNQQPEWLMWLTEHGVRILILLAIAFMAFVYTRSRSSTEERLGAIEANVQSPPARAYSPPDLTAYDPGGVTADELEVHQAAYVPAYSHVYYDGGRPYLLEITLSIRNIDVDRPIYVGKADYYDTAGKITSRKLDGLIKLAPLQTIEFLVQRHDVSGGSGANFIVEWHAEDPSVHPPLIEAVMVGRSGTNAISFVRKSEPLTPSKKKKN